MQMSNQAGGFLHTQLAATVAFLLNTSEERAQNLINGLRHINDVDSETLAVVSDLIITSLHHSPDSDDIDISAYA